MKRLLTGPKKDFFYCAFVVLIIANTTFYIGGFFVEIFACAPRAKIWNPLIDGTCLDGALLSLIAGVFNCASDTLMLILPICAIWRLGIDLKLKLGVMAVFATGSVACILSGLRIYFGQMLLGQPDITFYSIAASCVSAGEATAVMLVVTLPTLPRFIKFVLSKGSTRITTVTTDPSFGYSRPSVILSPLTPTKPIRAVLSTPSLRRHAQTGAEIPRPATAEAWLYLGGNRHVSRQGRMIPDTDRSQSLRGIEAPRNLYRAPNQGHSFTSLDQRSIKSLPTRPYSPFPDWNSSRAVPSDLDARAMRGVEARSALHAQRHFRHYRSSIPYEQHCPWCLGVIGGHIHAKI